MIFSQISLLSLRPVLAGLSVVFLSLSLVSCGDRSGDSPSDDVVVIRVGHTLDPTHTVHKAMLVMAEALQRESQGSMRIDLYPSGQLGNERELIELLQIGSLGMTKVSASPLEAFVPTMKIFNLPYLFRDRDHFLNTLDSEYGRHILESIEPARLRGLGYYDAGSRSFYTTSRQVTEPDDLTGLKIRVQESQTAMRMISSMGGSPTPISWGELYTALQQGVVDGAENNPPSFYLSHHYEVAPFYTLDEHTAVPDVILISHYVWNNLTPTQQGWLQSAVDESVEYQRVQWQADTDYALEKVIAAGVTILRPDKSLFEQKTADLLLQFEGTEVGALITNIKGL